MTPITVALYARADGSEMVISIPCFEENVVSTCCNFLEQFFGDDYENIEQVLVNSQQLTDSNNAYIRQILLDDICETFSK